MLPSKNWFPGSSNHSAIIAHVEVKVANATDNCAVVVVVWQSSSDRGAAFSGDPPTWLLLLYITPPPYYLALASGPFLGDPSAPRPIIYVNTPPYVNTLLCFHCLPIRWSILFTKYVPRPFN